MRALTIWQPWAVAIVLGFKRYETRSWTTNYRGPLLIHAATRWTKYEIAFHRVAADNLRKAYGPSDARCSQFERSPALGAVLAIAYLVDCHRTDGFRANDSSVECMFGDFSPGRFAFQIENVVPISPIHAAGKQGLWVPGSDLQDLVIMSPPAELVPVGRILGCG